MSHPLIDALKTQQTLMLSALEALVCYESPSRDKPALDALADRITAVFAQFGPKMERIPNEFGGDHLHFRIGKEGDDTLPALLIAHYDTVWPIGTTARLPFRVEGGKAYGPGAFDMKASIVLAEYALWACENIGKRPPRPVELLFTSDEEIGSPTSRGLIESLARRAAYVLVLEPTLPDGRLKTGRKGVGSFTMEITGRASHAGAEPEKGVSAVVELAHQILAITALANPSAGTTLNVGIVQGGTAGNVVPAAATALIDARAMSSAETQRIESALASLPAVLPGATVVVRGGFNRPPMERTPAVADLFEKARVIGRELGLDLGEGSSGGGSDANFTAALGLPTLDGLGAVGAGAHADDEHVVVERLAERAALLAALLLEL
jgi:glutamate carboxypeptidase